MRAGQTLKERAGGTDVDRYAPAGNVRVGFQSGREGLESFAFVFHFIAGEHGLDNLDALAHNRGRANFLSLFTFADFFHEDL